VVFEDVEDSAVGRVHQVFDADRAASWVVPGLLRNRCVCHLNFVHAANVIGGDIANEFGNQVATQSPKRSGVGSPLYLKLAAVPLVGMMEVKRLPAPLRYGALRVGIEVLSVSDAAFGARGQTALAYWCKCIVIRVVLICLDSVVRLITQGFDLFGWHQLLCQTLFFHKF
jgi:hypothetical protein